MGELATIGAISRRREKVAGMRGPGLVRYFMNPKVGTHLTGAARDKAQTDSAPVGVDQWRPSAVLGFEHPFDRRVRNA